MDQEADCNPLAAAACRLALGDASPQALVALREAGRWRHLPGPAPDRFAPLLAVADLDAFLRAPALARYPRVSLANSNRHGGAAVPPEAYVRDGETLDLPRLHAAFDAGATLVVAQFHEAHRPLALFCRGFELALRHAVQANVYLTPPGAQGFRVHYDTHDVLVLQVEGEKQWQLWDEQPVPRPTRRTPWAGGPPPEGESSVLRLRAGDALYVPRGTPHQAVAQAGGPSLHVTIGLLEPSVAAFLRFALDLLEAEHPALRAPLATWNIGLPAAQPAVEATLRDAAALMVRPENLERAFLGVMDRLAAEQPALLGRGLLPRPLDPDIPVRLAEAPLHAVAADAAGTAASLRWAGEPIPLAPPALAWLDVLAEGCRPAALGAEGAAFAERLHRLGLLVPHEAAGAA